MSYNIIETMNTRLKDSGKGAGKGKDKPDSLTRDIGGFSRSNQPFISGYFQAVFQLPDTLFTSGDEALTWLHSTCEGFTPPSQTLNKIDVLGQGQIGASFVASTSITREFTLTFREMQNMPILNTIRTWASVFDPHIGVSPLKGADFVPSKYKGLCYIIQTKPSMGADSEGNASSFEADDIEEIYGFDGVFPTTVPFDTAAASDIATNDSVQHSVTFSFDGFPLTKVDGGNELIERVKGLLNAKYMTTFDNRFKTLIP